MTDLHLVVPGAVDDPGRPSGGNTYDRRVAEHLPSLGWTVHEHAMPGDWPQPGGRALGTLARVLSGFPDGAVLLVDGLVASSAADVLLPEAGRLRIVVLVHLPLSVMDEGPSPGQPRAPSRTADAARPGGGGRLSEGERRVLSGAAAVVATSEWTRRWLVERLTLTPDHVVVARPGVDAAALAPGTATGGELLCVAAVTPAKGHDQLVSALALVADLDWRCVCAGSLTLEPDFVHAVREQARRAGIADRTDLVGPLGRADLDRAYAAADLVVHASRAETYGMVVTEALARGLPVVATAVGGVPEALGTTPEGDRPGLLVGAGATEELGGALRQWLVDPALRRRLRSLARQRRDQLTEWARTAQEISEVLHQVSGGERR